MTSLFKRLFEKMQKPVLPSRDVHALMRPLATPAIHVRKSASPSRSHLGSVPALPPGIGWPEHKGRRLGFLAQLWLPDIHAAHAIGWLPATGSLLFFYDIDEQPWGFDPADRGSARVLYVPPPRRHRSKQMISLARRTLSCPIRRLTFLKSMSSRRASTHRC